MKIQCDVCSGDEASVFCCADEAALCGACNQKVHHANKLAGMHRRFSVSSSKQNQPLCDICKEKRGFVFCQEDRAILCWDCDDPIHTANQLTMKHSRFLLTGARLSATPLVEPDNNSNCNKLIKENREQTIQNKPVTVEESTVSSCSSSISEYLIKTLPGYRVDDFLVNDADGLHMNDEMIPFLEPDLAVNDKDLPIWVPQASQMQSLNNYLSTGANGLIHCNYKELNQNQLHRYGQNEENFKDRWCDDSFMVPQISIPIERNNKRSRPSPAWDF